MTAFTIESLEAERVARYHAWAAVRRAKKAGQLVPPERCEQCGQLRKLEAHHQNYLEPMAVRWLCLACHRAAHRAARQRYKPIELAMIARKSMPGKGDSTPGGKNAPEMTPGAANDR